MRTATALTAKTRPEPPDKDWKYGDSISSANSNPKTGLLTGMNWKIPILCVLTQN